MSQLLSQLLGSPSGSGGASPRLLTLNAKVVRLLRHLGVPEGKTDALPASVVELWNGGKRLKAIRAYREATGVELKEARSRLERGFPSPMVQLERNVDQLLLHYRLPVESPLMMLPAVRAELERGRKIHAIKAYRAATGADLREAKDAVDEFERHLKK